MQEMINDILPKLYSSLTTIKLKNPYDIDYLKVIEDCKRSVKSDLKELTNLFKTDFTVFERNLKDILLLLGKVDISTDLLIEYFLELFNDVINNTPKITTQIPYSRNGNEFFMNFSFNIINELCEKSIDGLNFEEYYLDLYRYNDEDLIGTLKFLMKIALEKLESEKLDNEDFKQLMIMLTTAKEISKRVNQLGRLYLDLTALLEHLNRSDNKGLSINIARSLLLASFKDNMPEYGYYLLLCAFKGQNNIAGSLLAVLICLEIIKSKNGAIDNELVFFIVWQSLQLFVHERLIPNPMDIYDRLSKDFVTSDGKKFRIDNVYFDHLFLIESPELPQILVAYLKENIASIMKDDIIPWLIMIYHVDKNYYADVEAKSKLLEYKERFENILPKEVYIKRKTIVYGENIELARILTDSLLRIKEKNEAIFYADNVKSLLHTASRLIEYAYNTSSFKDFNLAMLVKADLSDLELTSSAIESKKMHIKDYLVEDFINKYEDVNTCKNILQNSEAEIVWLGHSENKVYEMNLSSDKLIFCKLNDWDFTKFFHWINNDLQKLLLETSIKISDPVRRRYEVRDLLFEEFIHLADIIKSNLDFAKIKINTQAGILLIKDLYLCNFPHNLLLDEEENFVLLNTPIADVIGVSWIDDKIRLNEKIDKEFPIEFWIPIEAGDRTLIQLESNLENAVIEHNIKLIKSKTLESPLNSEINIISAHGGSSISDFPAFMIEEDFFALKIDQLIGKGKILIMLVCHSGSMKQSKGKGQIDSLARRFLSKGYHAVIAPFWALHISIPPIWLPEFLNCLKEGFNVSEACYLANRKVYEQYPTPTAWASMHLYGNPFFSK